MGDISIGQLFVASYILLGMELLVFSSYVISKKILTKDRFKRFLGVLFIASSSSLVPLGPFGLICGFPSILLASILVTLFLDKDK